MWLDAAGFKGHIAAVTEEDVEPAEAHEAPEQRPEIRWGVGASVLLHVPLIAHLIFGLPKIEPKPPEDESVKVELVPPPEEKKPEEKKPEEKKPEKPPEPKPPEQAKKQPPPPPPPPPPPAKKASEQAKPPMPTLNPVTAFGDKNSGPDKFLAGNSSEGERKPAKTSPQHTSGQVPPKSVAEEPKPEAPPSKPVPDDVKLPEVAVMDVSPERNGPPTDASGDAKTTFEETKPPEQKSADKPKTLPETNDLPAAKTLFSRAADGNVLAQTAMEGLSRKERVATLCTTELQGQLVHGSPAYFPLALPSFGLRAGTILDVKDAAFGTAKGWFQVRFRCEVDEGATKVMSFAHQVGGPIPRSQFSKYDINE
ncbi:DUF930 domain-containing protein [Rhizobium phaseoli]